MLKKLTKKRNQKGFTLIELVVVIAILGILAAIAVPRFTGIQSQAKIDADAATAESIINAARIYDAQENKPGAAADTTTTDFPGNLIDIPKPQTGGSFEWKYESDYYTVTFGESTKHTYSEETSSITK